MNSRFSLCLSILLTLLVGSSTTYSGVTGKVSGIVSDSLTKEVLIGATVRVDSTGITTLTDEDGEFFILNVPVGKYDLTVTHIGFDAYVKKGVRVLMDLTTPVNFGLKQVALELGNKTVVYADEALIQRDLTASRVIFTADRLKSLPNTVNVQSILSYYPGVITDRDNNIHVRGGRDGQLSYSYDGFSVQDPFLSDAGIRIMPSALEELSLISGGYDAEYGEALSGVVGAALREGTRDFRGGVRVYEGATHLYDVSTGRWGGLKRNSNRSGSFNLSGPLPWLDPNKYTFLAVGELLRENPSLPHSLSTIYTGTAKLSLRPTPNLKIKANVTYSESNGDVYEHRDVNGVSFDFNQDGLPVFEGRSYLVGISGNLALNKKTIFSARLSRFSSRRIETPRHLKGLHWSQWPGYSEDSNGVYNGTVQDFNYSNDLDFSNEFEAVGFVMGDRFDPTYRFRQADYNSFSTSMTSQLNKYNQFKTGFDYRRYDTNRDFRQFFNDNPFRELFHNNPVYISFFVQDKIEYANFIINAGLRYDYRDIDIAYNFTPRDTVAQYKDADTKQRVSPRFGMSFPISEKSVMHFNYGIYYQLSKFQYLFANLEGNISSGLPLLGNPDLDPEQTTSYELGVDHLIGSSLRFDITAYVKDVSDLVSTRESFQVAGNPVTSFVNADYGSVKGFDISLERLRQEDHLSASISYGYMIARGNGSNALEPYHTYITSLTDNLAPVSDFPLDFDQRHTMTARIDYRVPASWKGKVFGIPLPSEWGISLVDYFGSGLPFTKTTSKGIRLGERNANRLPNFHRMDMRFNKDFRFAGGRNKISFFVEVDNLFNRFNVIDVFTTTGQPDDDNQAIGAGFALNQSEITRLDKLYDHDPQNFSAPRTVRTGLELSF